MQTLAKDLLSCSPSTASTFVSELLHFNYTGCLHSVKKSRRRLQASRLGDRDTVSREVLQGWEPSWYLLFECHPSRACGNIWGWGWADVERTWDPDPAFMGHLVAGGRPRHGARSYMLHNHHKDCAEDHISLWLFSTPVLCTLLGVLQSRGAVAAHADIPMLAFIQLNWLTLVKRSEKSWTAGLPYSASTPCYTCR